MPQGTTFASAQAADVLSFVRQKGQTQHRRDAFLLGDVDRLSGSGLQAMPKRAPCRDRGVHSGLQLRLMAVELERRQFREGEKRGVSDAIPVACAALSS